MPDNQGAAGVRLEIVDNSTFTIPVTPLTIGGTVGYSTKGPFNTIVPLNSIADVTTYLGAAGYQSPKYNQALLTARSILLAGAGAEFIRILSETKDISAGKGDLKSDAWLFKYDRTATTTNFTGDFFAATTNVAGQNARDLDGNDLGNAHADGYAPFGDRDIYEISRVVSTRELRNFTLDSSFIGDEIALCSIIPIDPSSTLRGSGTGSDFVTVKTATNTTWNANGTYTFALTGGIPTDGDTVGLFGTTFEFDDDESVTSGNVSVTIGADIEETLTNLKAAFIANLDSIERVYFLNTTKNTLVVEYLGFDYGTANPSMTGPAVMTVTNYGNNVEYKGEIVIANDPTGGAIDGTGTPDYTVAGASELNGLIADDRAVAGNVGATANTIDLGVTAPANGTPVYFPDVGTLTIGSATIDSASDEFTIGVALEDGLPVVITDNTTGGTGVTVGGAAPGATVYYIVNATATEFQVAATAGGAALSLNDGTPSGGTIDISTVFMVNGQAVTTSDIYYVVGSSGNTIQLASTIGGSALAIPDYTNAGAGTIDVAYAGRIVQTGEGITDGTAFKLYQASATTPSEFVDGSVYYVVNSDDTNEFWLSETLGGDPIAFTGTYTGVINLFDLAAQTGLSIGDTITVFDSVYEFTNTTLTAGDVKIAVPATPATSLTSGQIANLVIKALENNESPLIEFESAVDDTDTTGNTVIVTYKYRGPDLAAIETALSASTTATDVVVVRPSAAATYTTEAMLQVDDTAFPVAERETQPTTQYENVIIDSEFGIIFEGLGLADERIFRDVNGTLVKKYQLTTDGDVAARSYISVDMEIGGLSRSFSGTLVPFVADDVNLYIVEQTEEYAHEFAFVVNDSDVFEDAFSEGIIDLGSVVVDSMPVSGITQYADDETASDDADAFALDATLTTFIWSYDPRKNASSDGFASAWQLFLDKDVSDVFVLAAAGTNIRNLFAKGRELLDMNVISSMLDVCEKRKDCIAIFDTVDEKNVDEVIRKSDGVSGLSNEMARWGSIYDGRATMDDVFYTKLTVDVLKSVSVINRILSNTRGGLWWIPPAGFENGQLNRTFSRAQKYPRSYNYAGDANSDIAKLYDSKINPTRVTQGGQYLYGQKTLQAKTSAFQRMNVSMLIAGINKRFEKFLDRNVFLLNTRELREEITATLQAELDSIQSASPAGITSGRIVCDTSNNTPEIIRQRKLIVDIVDLRATEAAEFITLRTTLEQSGESTTVNTQLI